MPSNFRKLIALSAIGSLRITQDDLLNNRHFLATLVAAFLLHVLVLYVWYLQPPAEVVDIPVRALNIKLGDGDMLTQEELKAIEPNGANNARIEDTLAKLIQEPEPKDAKSSGNASSAGKAKDVGAFNIRSEGTKAAAPVMPVSARQFVRDLGAPAKSEVAGNSNSKEAEIVSRYEQLISLWIQKFKIYPDAARTQGMQGETVVRIRIDRRGTIRYYELDRSTGHQLLDRAAIDMIRRANPVPAVPADYPPGDLLEFLIPVHFELQ